MHQNPKRKVGRKPKEDPSVYRYTVNLNARENSQLRMLMQEAGEKNRSQFIASMITGKEMRVVSMDKSMLDCYRILTRFYEQFRAVGVNYNQTVKAIHRTFGMKRAFFLLRKLQSDTEKLSEIFQSVHTIVKEMEGRWLQK